MPTRNEVLLEAFRKGFRVSRDGSLITPDTKPRSIHIYQNYPAFNMRHCGVSFHVQLHRLAAYEKFGDVIFEENILVRHAPDDDKTNCRWDNLKIGTTVQNWDDMPDHKKEKCMANLKHKKKGLTESR